MNIRGLIVRVFAAILIGFSYLKMWDAVVDVGRLAELILAPYDILLEWLLRYVQALSIQIGIDIHEIAVFFIFTVGSFLLTFYGTVKKGVGWRALAYSVLHTAIFFVISPLPARFGLPVWLNSVVLLVPYFLIAAEPPKQATFAYPARLWRRVAGGAGILIASFVGFVFLWQVTWLQGISRFPDIIVCKSITGENVDCSEGGWLRGSFEFTLALDANPWIGSTTTLILIVLVWCLVMMASHKARLSRLAINLVIPFALATIIVFVSQLFIA